MALADDEAQLAGVLAHEIGHITALHHARRYGQSILANVGLTALGILVGREAAQIGQLGIIVVFAALGRLLRPLVPESLRGNRVIPAYAIGSLAAFWVIERTVAMLTTA